MGRGSESTESGANGFKGGGESKDYFVDPKLVYRVSNSSGSSESEAALP